MAKKPTGERKRAAPPKSGTKPPKPLYISFLAQIDATTSAALIGTIGQHLPNFDELHLMLSTPGGHVNEGIALYNMLRALPLKLTTYNVGSVNSIGIVVFLAGSTRYANRTSSFMFHGVGLDVVNARFEEKQMMERLDSLRNDQSLIAEIITRRTRISDLKTKDLFLQADFIRAVEAKPLGIIDEIRDASVPKGVKFLQLVFKR